MEINSLTLVFQYVQYRNSSGAWALCQPRHVAIALNKMFPGTTE